MECNTNLNILVQYLKYATLSLKELDLQQKLIKHHTRVPFFSINFAPKTFRCYKYLEMRAGVFVTSEFCLAVLTEVRSLV